MARITGPALIGVIAILGGCKTASAGWLQGSGPVRNPYYGASMLECGEKMN